MSEATTDKYFNEAVMLTEYDKEMVDELRPLYFDEIKQSATLIESFLSDGNYAEIGLDVKQVVHKLKSTALVAKAFSIQITCEMIEVALKMELYEVVDFNLGYLHNELADVVRSVE